MSESIIDTNGKDLIEPMLFYGPGSCPICLSLLMLADRETTVMELNKDGSVSNIEGSYNVSMAMCPKCKNTYPMMRYKGTYRPASTFMKLQENLDIQEEIDLRKKNFLKKHDDTNPLSL